MKLLFLLLVGCDPVEPFRCPGDPDATEVCDGVDNDCDLLVDEDCVDDTGADGLPPDVQVLSPVTGSSFAVGESVVFDAVAADDTTPAAHLLASWESDVDGVLGPVQLSGGEGRFRFETAALSEAEHTVCVRVLDEASNAGLACVGVHVGAEPESAAMDDQEQGEPPAP